MKAFYKHVNSKLNVSCSIAPIKDNSTLLTSDSDKAHVFKKYFASVFSPTTDINMPVRDSRIFSPCVNFSSDLVYKALLNFKYKYSSGPDGIPTLFWANLASSLTVPISIIVSISYHFATVSSKWKCADVISLFKKGNPSVIANYRPITLTCMLGKVMEQVIRDNSLAYVLAQNLTSVDQHGFMTGISTCLQLLSIIMIGVLVWMIEVYLT